MPNQLAKSMHEIAKQNRIAQRGPTNADRIRGMSNEEMANFIGAVATKDWEFRSMYGGYSAALDWLRQPAEEGTT